MLNTAWSYFGIRWLQPTGSCAHGDSAGKNPWSGLLPLISSWPRIESTWVSQTLVRPTLESQNNRSWERYRLCTLGRLLQTCWGPQVGMTVVQAPLIGTPDCWSCFPDASWCEMKVYLPSASACWQPPGSRKQSRLFLGTESTNWRGCFWPH